MAILILLAFQNKYELLAPLVPRALEALKQIKPGEIVEIIQRAGKSIEKGYWVNMRLLLEGGMEKV